MNGEMYQISTIVAAAKKALADNAALSYVPAKYVKRIEFCFLPEKDTLKQKTVMAKNVPLWFEHCKRKKLEDVKLLCPVAVKNRESLGFSNTTESMILCFYGDGSVTYFTSSWQFNSFRKAWNILYTEREWSNPPSEKPHFENNTSSFQKVLKEIGELAVRIECEEFAKIFESAGNILNGSGECPDLKYGLELPAIPKENIPLFEAASIADVFGAMGSWNDSPPCMAHEKGLDAEYKTLSGELLKNIRLALLYAVNEW